MDKVKTIEEKADFKIMVKVARTGGRGNNRFNEKYYSHKMIIVIQMFANRLVPTVTFIYEFIEYSYFFLNCQL